MAVVNMLPTNSVGKTLLWQNPSPSSNMGQTTIQLSADATIFKKIRIKWAMGTDGEWWVYQDYDYTEHPERWIDGQPKFRFCCVARFGNDIYCRYGHIWDTDNTKIQMMATTKVGGSGAYNQGLIPLEIYGLK